MGKPPDACQCYQCGCCENKEPDYVTVTISGVVPRDNCSDCGKHNVSSCTLLPIPCVPCGWYLMGACYEEEYGTCVHVDLIEFDMGCNPGDRVASFVVRLTDGSYRWTQSIAPPFDCDSKTFTFTFSEEDSEEDEEPKVTGNPICDYSKATIVVTLVTPKDDEEGD